MQSKAKTVAQYLKELPPDRREIVARVREVILENLDDAFEEGMQYGMIGYYVPHSVFPDGYHCDPKQPLPFAGLASQKNHLAVYLMAIYSESAEENWFRREWTKTGKKLDMGKCCVRFKKLEDVALDVIGQAIQRVSARDYIDYYVRVRQEQQSERAAKQNAVTRKKSAKKSVGKPVGKLAGKPAAAAKPARKKSPKKKQPRNS